MSKDYPRYLGEHDGKIVVAKDAEHHEELKASHPLFTAPEPKEPGPTADEERSAVAQLHEAHARIAAQDGEIERLKAEIQRLQSPATGQFGDGEGPTTRRKKAETPPSPV